MMKNNYRRSVLAAREKISLSPRRCLEREKKGFWCAKALSQYGRNKGPHTERADTTSPRSRWANLESPRSKMTSWLVTIGKGSVGIAGLDGAVGGGIKPSRHQAARRPHCRQRLRPRPRGGGMTLMEEFIMDNWAGGGGRGG